MTRSDFLLTAPISGSILRHQRRLVEILGASFKGAAWTLNLLLSLGLLTVWSRRARGRRVGLPW